MSWSQCIQVAGQKRWDSPSSRSILFFWRAGVIGFRCPYINISVASASCLCQYMGRSGKIYETWEWKRVSLLFHVCCCCLKECFLNFLYVWFWFYLFIYFCFTSFFPENGVCYSMVERRWYKIRAFYQEHRDEIQKFRIFFQYICGEMQMMDVILSDAWYWNGKPKHASFIT